MSIWKKLGGAVIAIITLSACGRPPVLELGEFAPYVSSFEKQSEQVGKPVKVSDLIVKFGQTEERQDAVCETRRLRHPNHPGQRNCMVQLNEDEREALMFHELGHCVLGRAHTTTRNTEGVPVSLMYPIAINASVYLENREAYIHELFLKTAL